MNWPEENRHSKAINYVFRFFGPPGAGQTTRAGMLAAELRQLGRCFIGVERLSLVRIDAPLHTPAGKAP